MLTPCKNWVRGNGEQPASITAVCEYCGKPADGMGGLCMSCEKELGDLNHKENDENE